MPSKSLSLIFAATLLTGCQPKPPAPQTSSATQTTTKTFTIRGKVIATDPTHVTLDGEAVPGFMEPMTMDYALKDPTVRSELHPGDRIAATVFADTDPANSNSSTGPAYTNVRLDNIIVIAQARPDYKPPFTYHVPTSGDAVPDFKLLNQSGRTIHLSQFRGKLLLLTFVYTRCPLADFCPRMSRNFADIDHALAADPALYQQTHLLSISFDPTYDTPKVLRSYGGAYTGRYTKETFAHWDFAAPTPTDLAPLTQYFNVGVTAGGDKEGKTLTHSLSTVLIGKDGKIIDWYPTNDWQPSDVLTQIKKSAA